MIERRPDIWLPSYVRMAPGRAYARLRRRRQLTHIILLVCDHFEPRHGVTTDQQPFERLQAWRAGYSQFQQRCRSAFGRAPVHTWFYPPHHGLEHLESLGEMVFDGLGEVELHYHHQNDTIETLRAGICQALADYHRWGLLLSCGAKPNSGFGFIHGDWALNNSCNGKFCGVNNETSLLQDLGCWADFTMPSGDRCQTRKINSIYYANSDSRRPKAHDSGVDARAGVCDQRGLLFVQGPLAINWRAPAHPRIENASLTSRNWGRPDRIRTWLGCDIHIKGRPDWLFVKLHTHGAIERDFDALFGERAFAMQLVLNERFNDGRRYRLHYVTARQAYNLIKAAERGAEGDPSEWTDCLIAPPVRSLYSINAPHDVEYCTKGRLIIGNIDCQRLVSVLASEDFAVRRVTGMLRSVDQESACSELRIRTREAVGSSWSALEIEMNPGFVVVHLEGAEIVEEHTDAERRRITLKVRQQCRIGYRRASVVMSRGVAVPN